MKPGDTRSIRSARPKFSLRTDKNDYITRDKILKLLSDDEVSAVSTAETATALVDGDEFVDLNKFDFGVQRGLRSHTPMNRVLPKKSMNLGTWTKIVAQLPEKSAR